MEAIKDIPTERSFSGVVLFEIFEKVEAMYEKRNR